MRKYKGAMSKVFLFLCMAVANSAAASGGDLIGHWTFDEGNANDVSGNGNNGVIIGATPTNGVSGGAYHFDGNNRIEVGNLDFATQEYTVNGWIRTTEPAVTECWRMWIGKMNPPSGDATFELLIGDGRRVGGGPNGPGYLVWRTPGIGLVSLPEASDLNLRDGHWHMMTATYRSGSQKLYVDGALVAESQYSGPLPLVSDVVSIGGIDGFGPYHHPWIGDIDEVSIYNRALDSSEVMALWSAVQSGLYFSKRATSSDSYHLFTVQPDPANPNLQSVPMNDPSGDQKHPVVSPDGRFVLYAIGSAAYQSFQVWALDRLTGQRQYLFEGLALDWHPSGQRFAFIPNAFCSTTIHEAFVNVTPTGLVISSTRLVFDCAPDYPAGALGAQYSPDGRSIAYNYNPNAGCYAGQGYVNSEIYTASLEEELPIPLNRCTRLTTNSFCDYEPHWTPDGRQILWGRGRSGGPDLELWRKNTDGSGAEQLVGIWSNASDAYLAFCTPPAGYTGPYQAAFYHQTLKNIILLRNDGGQETLGIGTNDFVDGLDWVLTGPCPIADIKVNGSDGPVGSHRIERYRIYGIGDSYNPTAWTFEGSSNNINWIPLDQHQNYDHWSWRTFDINNTNAYRFYRVNISSGDCYGVAISEMEMMEGLPGGAYTTDVTSPTGLVTASDTCPGYSARGAVDNILPKGIPGSSTNGWLSINSAPWWLQYDFGTGSAKVIKRYRINDEWQSYRLKTWTFEGSNDGATWTVLDQHVNYTDWFVETFNFSNPNAYRYYRMNISTGGYYGIAIGEMEMMERVQGLLYTEDLTGGGTASVSEILPGYVGASGAFDNYLDLCAPNENTWLITNSIGWLAYDFGPVALTSSGTLSATIHLTPGSYLGQLADWWVLAHDVTRDVWYQYVAPFTATSWVAPWNGGPSAQGPLFALPSYEILHLTGLAAGRYDLYFGIDLTPNGLLDFGTLYYDSVTVNVTP